MRTFVLTVIAGITLCGSRTCDAGGFFRRLPEVGEWARYETHHFRTHSNAPGDIVDLDGTTTLKCVGEEIVDQERYFWIEKFVELPRHDGIMHTATLKMLVPADQMIDGNLVEYEMRGWLGGGDSDTRPVVFSTASHIADKGFNFRMTFFPGTEPTETQESKRTVVVDEVEWQLPTSESHPIVSRSYDDGMTVFHSATYWPHDELAFGVAAAELHWTHRRPDYDVDTIVRYELVATGTDAVSDLPDHN